MAVGTRIYISGCVCKVIRTLC